MKRLFGKYKNMPAEARASLWYTVCNILQKGISFFVVPVYTRLLTTAEYGEYSVFQSWQSILIIFATLSLYCGVFTKAMVDYDEDRDRYVSCMQGLSTLLTLALFLVYLVAFRFWNGLLKMDTVTMVLMFVYFIAYPSLSFWSVRQRVELKYVKMVAVTLLTSVATPIVSILLLKFTSLRAQAVIWGFLSVQIAVGLFFYVYQYIRGKVFYVKEYWLHGLKFNIPLIPHYLSLIVLGQADRIMIEHYAGKDKAGIYNLAYQVSLVMNVIISAVNGSLVPWTYEKLKKKNYSDIRNITVKLCILMATMTGGVMLVAPEAVRILGTEEYMEAVWVIPSVALSTYVTFCYGLFSNVEFYYGSTKLVMIASTVGAVLNIILNAIFIPLTGFIAAGYTTLACYLVFMAMHYFFMRKVLKKEKVGEPVYDTRFIVFSCFLLAIFGGICMFLYGGNIGMAVRYVIVAAAVVLAFVFRKKLTEIIRSVRK